MMHWRITNFHAVLKIIFSVFITAILAERNTNASDCSSGFESHYQLHLNKSICIRIFQFKYTWTEASDTCKGAVSNLIEQVADKSSVHHALKVLGIKLLWTGIRRRGGYYIRETSGAFFTISLPGKDSDWGLRWKDKNLTGDCVALDISSGYLVSLDCSSRLDFICENEGFSERKVKHILCPEDWFFAPLISFESERCVRIFSPQEYEGALATCRREKSHLATVDYYGHACEKDEYIMMAINETMFWAEGSDSDHCVAANMTMSESFTMEVVNFTCKESLPFICKRGFLNISVDLEAYLQSLESKPSPEVLEYYPRTDTPDIYEKFLICDLKVNNNRSADNYQFASAITYRWYKNEIPMHNQNAPSLHVGFYSDETKRRNLINVSNKVTWQGTYHCEIQLLGSSITYRSPNIDFFFSDVATYIIQIKGLKKSIYDDYSNPEGFKSFLETVTEGGVNEVMEQIQDLYPHSDWDYHNTSLYEDDASVTLLLYFHRSPEFDKSELKHFKKLKGIFQDFNFSKELGKLSVAVYCADVCFDETEFGSKTSCNEDGKWPRTFQAQKVSSLPQCFDENWKLISRTCKADLIHGAQWEPVNCSACIHKQEKLPDLDIKCPDGFLILKENLCYKIHHDPQIWDEANEICEKSSSFLLNDIFPDISIQTEFWLSLRYSYGKVQSLYRRFKTERLLNKFNASKVNPDLHCASAVWLFNDYELNLKNCSEKLSFVCLHEPYKVLSTIRVSKIWSKYSDLDNSCYYIENAKETWRDAIESCPKLFHQSSLLHNIQDAVQFKFFRNVQRHLHKSGSWWMNLFENESAYEWMHSSSSKLAFVDWDPYTELKLNVTAPVLMFNAFAREITWSLDYPYLKRGYICEIEDCKDLRPTQAYIEDRTIDILDKSNEDEFRTLRGDLRCVPSGWFNKDSILWYKDGILCASDSICGLPYQYTSSIDLKIIVQYQGYYWCSVEQNNSTQKIFSSKLLHRTPGIHTYVISIKSAESKHLSYCTEFMMSELSVTTEHSSSLLQCFNGFLKDKFPMSYLNVILRNVSCDNAGTNMILHIHFNAEEGSEVNTYKKISNIINLKNENTSIICDIERAVITVSSTVICPQEQVLIHGKNITWPSTVIGQSAIPIELCVTESGSSLVRKCLGDFNTGAKWESPTSEQCIYLNSVLTKKLYELAHKDVSKGYSLMNIASNLSQLTAAVTKLKALDMHYIAEILEDMVEFPVEKNLGLLYPVIQTFSNVIEAANIINSEQLTVDINRVLISVKSMIMSMHLENNGFRESTKNVAVGAFSLNNTVEKTALGAILMDSNLMLSFDENPYYFEAAQNVEDFEAGIELPREFVKKSVREGENHILFMIGKNFYFTESSKVVSPLISVFVGQRPRYDIDPPIKMSFRVQMIEAENLPSLKCVYWDQKLNNSFGGWSWKGCFSELKDNILHCSCDHLTSFAVVLDRNGEILVIHQRILSTLTFIGCSISCFGLIIIIFTFILFRKWRTNVKNKALFNFSLALLSFLIIFMTGVERTNSKNLCMIVSVFLHYFLLSTFAWMLVTAILQYYFLVRGRKVLDISYLIQKAAAFAWGIPFVFIVIVLCINFEHYMNTQKYCLLSGDISFYTMTLPVLLMLVINFFIFGRIFHTNTCGRPSSDQLRSNQDQKKLAVMRTKALFCISVLLGLTWIFGFLALGSAKVWFHYLFTLTTTLQGFFMFIIFVIRYKSTQDMWKNFFLQGSDKAHISHVTGMTDVTTRTQNKQKRHLSEKVRATFQTDVPYVSFSAASRLFR